MSAATCDAGEFFSSVKIMVLMPSRDAAMADMRPNWPPPKIPMVCNFVFDFLVMKINSIL